MAITALTTIGGYIIGQDLNDNFSHIASEVNTHLADEAKIIINPTIAPYNAPGVSGQSSTVGLQAALDAVIDNVGATVMLPRGTFEFTDITVKPKTSVIGTNKHATILKYMGTTADRKAITISQAVAGPDGYVTFENLTIHCNDNTIATLTAIGCSVAGAPKVKFKNVIFTNWTKYCIHLPESWNVEIESCIFDGIVGVATSGDIGTAILMNSNNNALRIKNCIFLRCDRFIQVDDSVNVYDVVIDGNTMEEVGYLRNDTKNTEYATYTCIAITRATGVSIKNNNGENFNNGEFLDANTCSGVSLKNNVVHGQEAGYLGGLVTLLTAFKISSCKGVSFKSNIVDEYVNYWLSVEPGCLMEGIDGTFSGVDTNIITDGGVQVYFPTGTRNVNQVQVPVAPTLLNSWANYGSNYQTAGYYRDSNGIVHLQGVITGGSLGTVMFTLPTGFRPTLAERFKVDTDNVSGASVYVLVTGNVQHIQGDTVQVSLSGIQFKSAT